MSLPGRPAQGVDPELVDAALVVAAATHVLAHQAFGARPFPQFDRRDDVVVVLLGAVDVGVLGRWHGVVQAQAQDGRAHQGICETCASALASGGLPAAWTSAAWKASFMADHRGVSTR